LVKKLRFLSVLLLVAMLIAILWTPCMAFTAEGTNIVDSVLPDLPRQSTTTAPDSGIPILPGQGEGDTTKGREESGRSQQGGEPAVAPSPVWERFSVGAALLLLGLSLLAVVAAVRYVFRSKHTRHRD
jgi:hypothetical protein